MISNRLTGTVEFGSIEQAGPDPNISLSIVVPCFNEQDVLIELERRLCEICDEIVPQAYEIILVNDGSRDRTGKIIAEIIRRNPRIICIELSRNFGHQIALTAGLSFARGRRISHYRRGLTRPSRAAGRNA